ncbi:MAG: ATP-binding cassette domain-containing protein [Gemmatimonadota bacterium]|uniref:ABC transporter ATP-binding protein n=1 Tax=Candidatus Palauibacter scopulicola TaxID=3056741 RepID=UPI00239ED2FF|nr:ATP-binding cassette domain-containing protein [Candidatus Palauibacter scopulicola]MDE2664031.1 ATP-binding cassette domain-containing protein [Candidatus Palauibacter scopulicola]
MSDRTPAGGPEPGSEAFEAELRDEIRRELETHGGGSAQPEIVELRDVWLSFGDHEVLRGVSLGVARGGTLCILGGSGVGKSTILRLMLRLLLPDRGEVLIEGRDISAVSRPEALALRERMGMVFQGSALFDSLNVFDNVAFPLYEHTKLGDDEVRDRVEEVLSFVDLDPTMVLPLLPSALSGGMRKRVAIARAIVHRPPILLFDEPTSGLDPITTRRIDELILKLRRELHVCVVVVTHDVRSAARIATETALLKDGKIIFSGTPEEMHATEDRYVRAFRG